MVFSQEPFYSYSKSYPSFTRTHYQKLAITQIGFQIDGSYIPPSANQRASSFLVDVLGSRNSANVELSYSFFHKWPKSFGS